MRPPSHTDFKMPSQPQSSGHLSFRLAAGTFNSTSFDPFTKVQPFGSSLFFDSTILALAPFITCFLLSVSLVRHITLTWLPSF